jgi:hypothetical protein
MTKRPLAFRTPFEALIRPFLPLLPAKQALSIPFLALSGCFLAL